MPEQQTLSIKVSVAPRVAHGLAPIVEKLLTRAGSRRRKRGGDIITNSFSGTANETVIQIGKLRRRAGDDPGR